MAFKIFNQIAEIVFGKPRSLCHMKAALVRKSYQALSCFPSHPIAVFLIRIAVRGPCGVCSSAQDFATRTSSRVEFTKLVTSCGTTYFTGQRSFSTLVTCFRYAGFTEPCAKLWSHFTATTGELCANECLGGLYQLNGDPPECAPGECIACGQQFQQDFDDISGSTPLKAGFTEQPAHACSLFYPVVHDPCPLRQNPTPAPVPKTSDASSLATSAAITMIWLLILR